MSERQTVKRRAPLGRSQKHVLLVLSTRGEATASDWAAWFPLRGDAARGALDRLYRRGLVQPTRFGLDGRYWSLSAAGEAAVADLCEADELS